MKVKNMTSARGNKIANQFIIKEYEEKNGKLYTKMFFQSYSFIVAKKTCKTGEKLTDGSFGLIRKTYLDKTYWDYSTTTGKYRNIFLGEEKADTQRKIDSGEYKLVNLN